MSKGWQWGLQENLNITTNNHNSACAVSPPTGMGHLETAAEDQGPGRLTLHPKKPPLRFPHEPHFS